MCIFLGRGLNLDQVEDQQQDKQQQQEEIQESENASVFSKLGDRIAKTQMAITTSYNKVQQAFLSQSHQYMSQLTNFYQTKSADIQNSMSLLVYSMEDIFSDFQCQNLHQASVELLLFQAQLAFSMYYPWRERGYNKMLKNFFSLNKEEYQQIVHSNLKTLIRLDQIKVMQLDNNKVSLPVFIVYQDDMKHTINIVIRGTSTVHDGLTDCKIIPSEVENKGFFHKGFYTAACEVFLQCEQIIAELETYDIVIIGHSYGGAIASIMTYFISQKLPNRQVKCVNFGCPPSMDYNLCDQLIPLVDSYIYLDDPVPHMSLHSMTVTTQRLAKENQQSKLFDLSDKYKAPNNLFVPGTVYYIGQKCLKQVKKQHFVGLSLAKNNHHNEYIIGIQNLLEFTQQQ